MSKFIVEMEGANFLIDVEGERSKHGFVSVRCIEADNARTAEVEAVERVRTSPRLRELVLNPPDDPPVMLVTRTVEIAGFDHVEGDEPGLVWYPENPRRWRQFWRR